MAWPMVCGSGVADRTQALRFADGVLTVAVADNGWKLELQTLAPRYLAVINRYTGAAVRRIEFVVSPEAASPEHASSKGASPEGSTNISR